MICLCNIGAALDALGRYEEALKYHYISLHHAQEAGIEKYVQHPHGRPVTQCVGRKLWPLKTWAPRMVI